MYLFVSVDGAERIFIKSADRARPVFGNFLERSSRCDTGFRRAFFRIVNVIACRTFVALHDAAFGHFFPVDKVPEGIDECGPPVTVIDVVSMFPYINDQYRFQVLCKWIACIGCTDNG